MKEQNRISLGQIEILYLSVLGVGFSRFAPGTMGTLATLPLLSLLGQLKVPSFFLIPVFVLATIGTCFLVEGVEKKYQLSDPSWIVIDEFLGILLAWIIAPTNNLIELLALFLLFRFFDITKVWPANWCDQKIKHGAGTILDDLVSGVYAGLVLLIWRALF